MFLSSELCNVQVEMLYQRYFLRMNQSNTTHILSLLLVLVLSLAAVHIILIPMESTSQFHKILQRNRYNDTINGNGSNISTIKPLNRSDNITNPAPLNSQQQNFVRLNYNYSTDNETGKRTLCSFPLQWPAIGAAYRGGEIESNQ